MWPVFGLDSEQVPGCFGINLKIAKKLVVDGVD